MGGRVLAALMGGRGRITNFANDLPGILQGRERKPQGLIGWGEW